MSSKRSNIPTFAQQMLDISFSGGGGLVIQRLLEEKILRLRDRANSPDHIEVRIAQLCPKVSTIVEVLELFQETWIAESSTGAHRSVSKCFECCTNIFDNPRGRALTCGGHDLLYTKNIAF